MASIRETMEAVFAAAAFAECDCVKEAYECLGLAQDGSARVESEVKARKDTRPRVRV